VGRLFQVATHVLRSLPEPSATTVRRTVQRMNRSLPGRRVRWGNVARRAPFSTHYGWDRGLPVDRHYIERFLAANQARIRGSVLEVQSAVYAARFGQPTSVTVLDIDPANANADLIADLNEPGSLPADAFDCVILTQVLQYTEPVEALRNIGQSLRPDGCALITVPTLSPIDPVASDRDRWRWTPRGLADAVHAAELDATVEGPGDALAAVAFMLGLAIEEVPARRPRRQDVRFPIVACAVVERPDRPAMSGDHRDGAGHA
jgi:SAM-dependent methyltransferase